MIDAEGRGSGSLRAQLEGLIAKWKDRAEGPIPTDRAIGICECADDLESILSSLKPSAVTKDEVAVHLCEKCERPAYVGMRCLHCGTLDSFAPIAVPKDAITQVLAQLECPHQRVQGGNDYHYCPDCSAYWDYRRETVNVAIARQLRSLLASAGERGKS